MPTAISDASPLIYCAAIGRFDLLGTFFDRVLIPPAVWTEVVEEGEGKPGARAVEEARSEGNIEVAVPEDLDRLGPVDHRLERGEAQAIVLAAERPGHLLLVDEHEGRKVAQALGVDVTGTIGLLLQAKREKRIAMVQPELDRL